MKVERCEETSLVLFLIEAFLLSKGNPVHIPEPSYGSFKLKL